MKVCLNIYRMSEDSFGIAKLLPKFWNMVKKSFYKNYNIVKSELYAYDVIKSET